MVAIISVYSLDPKFTNLPDANMHCFLKNMRDSYAGHIHICDRICEKGSCTRIQFFNFKAI